MILIIITNTKTNHSIDRNQQSGFGKHIVTLVAYLVKVYLLRKINICHLQLKATK